MSYNYILTPDRLTVVGHGNYIQVNKNDKNFDKSIELLREKKFDDIIRLNSVKKYIEDYLSDNLKIVNDQLYYKDQILDSEIARKIIEFRDNNLPFDYLINFLENLMLNPSKRSVEQLYRFLEHLDMPITEDGCFLGYKYVDDDYKDIFSRTFDNSIGSVCKMERSLVDDNEYNTCSCGLHVCSLSYLKSINVKYNHIMIVKVNPRDVVSIPVDYNNSKLRCCQYKVIDEYTNFNKDTPYTKNKVVSKEYEAVTKKYLNNSIRKGSKIVYIINGDSVIVRKSKGKNTYTITKNKLDSIL